MTDEEKIQKLAAQFAAFGADDPISWATSEVKEGIAQYARFVFLKQAWEAVVREDDFEWIDSSSQVSPVLNRMIDSGVSKRDIVDLVRFMQYQTLFTICYQLEDPGVVNYPDKAMPKVLWQLKQLDDNYEKVIGPISGLHESLLSLDPTGREMGPRSNDEDKL